MVSATGIASIILFIIGIVFLIAALIVTIDGVINGALSERDKIISIAVLAGVGIAFIVVGVLVGGSKGIALTK